MANDKISENEEIANAPCIFFYQGQSEHDEEVYIFLKTNPQKMGELLQKFSKKKNVDLADYGEVVAGGLGKPSDDVIQEMVDVYGYDPEQMIEFAPAEENS